MGKGSYLKRYKRGFGLYLKPWKGERLTKKNFLQVILSRRALTNQDLVKYVKIFKIPHFRGVFMHNALPVGGPKYNESAIINLDDASGPGTHWVSYRKRGNNVVYF